MTLPRFFYLSLKLIEFKDAFELESRTRKLLLVYYYYLLLD